MSNVRPSSSASPVSAEPEKDSTDQTMGANGQAMGTNGQNAGGQQIPLKRQTSDGSNLSQAKKSNINPASPTPVLPMQGYMLPSGLNPRLHSTKGPTSFTP